MRRGEAGSWSGNVGSNLSGFGALGFLVLLGTSSGAGRDCGASRLPPVLLGRGFSAMLREHQRLRAALTKFGRLSWRNKVGLVLGGAPPKLRLGLCLNLRQKLLDVVSVEFGGIR